MTAPEQAGGMSDLWRRATTVMPGGVNSPVRAYRAVGGVPRFLRAGSGARVIDASGCAYVDLVMSYGPLLFGHAAPEAVRAAAEAAGRGLTFGAPTEAEVALAEAVCRAVPSAERVRLVTSGTEAVMTAVRLGRAHAGRDGVMKFSGGYHGHSDPLLAQAGSGSLTLGLPASAGVPAAVVAATRTVPYGDLDAARRAGEAAGGPPAVILVEPVAGNMGVVVPPDGFLAGLRALADDWRSVLVFDEVITGFRLSRGGAQAVCGVTPDLTCLGKVLGGGMPLAAVAGRAEIMDRLAPLGDVYQAGTLAGHPVAVAVGLATLRRIEAEDPYPALERAGAQLEAALDTAARRAGVPHRTSRAGSLLSVRLEEPGVPPWQPVPAAEARRYAAFFHAMLEQGILLPPSPREAMFLSTAHGAAELDEVAAAAERALRASA